MLLSSGYTSTDSFSRRLIAASNVDRVPELTQDKLKEFIAGTTRSKAVVFTTTGESFDHFFTPSFRDFSKLVQNKGLLLYIVVFKQEHYGPKFMDKEREDFWMKLVEEGVYFTDTLILAPAYP